MKNGACGGRIFGCEVDAFLMSCIKKTREGKACKLRKCIRFEMEIVVLKRVESLGVIVSGGVKTVCRWCARFRLMPRWVTEFHVINRTDPISPYCLLVVIGIEIVSFLPLYLGTVIEKRSRCLLERWFRLLLVQRGSVNSLRERFMIYFVNENRKRE